MLPYVETVSNPLPRATVARGPLSFTGINTRAARQERRQKSGCIDKGVKSERQRVCIDAILRDNQKTANIYSCQLIDMKSVNYSKTSAIG